jgi:hypothetical protein
MVLRRIFFTSLLLLGMNMASSAYGAELLAKFHPYISIKEEYSDNLNLTSANKKDDFYTTVQPGIKFSNMDKMAGVDFDYSLGAVFYGKNSNLNYISHNALLNAKYLTAQRINFYLKESFIQSDDPREREYFTTSEDNKYVLATTTDRAVYWRNVVAPTIEYQFGPENRLGVNYRNNIYRTESASGQNSQEDYINPFFNYWFDKQNGISLEYGLTYGKFAVQPDLVGHMAKGRYTNRFSARSSAFAEYTYSKRTYAEPSTAGYDIHEPNVGMTFAFTPTLNASIQAGYYWMNSETGSGNSGYSYQGDLTGIDARTTYKLSLQGGYKEDLFTAENLGFTRYHRLTGSLNHQLDQRISIGCLGSVERAVYDATDRTDTIWGISGTASYMPLKWLTLALEVSHRENQSSLDTASYAENRVMLKMTATY